MPGGSVNGRPFKESKDSYERTGIPCGNPRRFKSQDVLRMAGDRSSQVRDLSGPVEDIETEGQRQLKTLVEKQLSTQTTVKEQLAQGRHFTHGTLFKPATDEIHGMIDLSDYRTLEENDSKVTELRACGLTEDEIKLKLQSEENSWDSKKPRLGYNPFYLDEKLKEIDRKIDEHKKSLSKPDTFSGKTRVGRHVMDLERSLVKDNIEFKKLSGMLLGNQTSSIHPHPEHPMNHIPEILQEMTHMTPRDNKRKRGKTKCSQCDFYETNIDSDNNDIVKDQISSLIDDVTGNDSERIGCQSKEEYLQKSRTKLDEISGENLESNISTSAIDCSLKKPTSIDKKVLSYMVKQVPESDIISNRLSLEEIRKIPKFENYEEGAPNNVLYLKNLPNKVTENELGSLFLRFQTDNDTPLSFRIMSGKMRGQAFVTFKDVETATQALHLVNGYKLNDTPIVIQYGKKS